MDAAESYLMHQLRFTRKPEYKPPRKMKNNNYSEKYETLSKKQIRELQYVYKFDIKLFGYPRTPFE